MEETTYRKNIRSSGNISISWYPIQQLPGIKIKQFVKFTVRHVLKLQSGYHFQTFMTSLPKLWARQIICTILPAYFTLQALSQTFICKVPQRENGRSFCEAVQKRAIWLPVLSEAIG